MNLNRLKIVPSLQDKNKSQSKGKCAKEVQQDTFPTCHWIFVEKQIRRDKHDVRFQFVRTSSSSQGIIPSLPLSMPLHSQRPPFCPVMYPSNSSSSLFHRAAWSSHPLYSSYSPSRNCYIWKICIPLSGKNDFVEIVEWICPIREIYMEFYHFIANDELNPLWNAIENVISLFR